MLISKIFVDFGAYVTLNKMGFSLELILITVFAIALLMLLDRIVTYDKCELSDSSLITVRGGAFVYIILVILFCWCFLISRDMISNFIYFRF